MAKDRKSFALTPLADPLLSYNPVPEYEVAAGKGDSSEATPEAE